MPLWHLPLCCLHTDTSYTSDTTRKACDADTKTHTVVSLSAPCFIQELQPSKRQSLTEAPGADAAWTRVDQVPDNLRSTIDMAWLLKQEGKE